MTKVAGGTCDFGGTAMLVTVDPSKIIFSFPVNFAKTMFLFEYKFWDLCVSVCLCTGYDGCRFVYY